MRVKIQLLWVALLILTGCAAPQYIVPPDVPTAYLRLKTDVQGSVSLSHAPQNPADKVGTARLAETYRSDSLNTTEKSPIRMLGTQAGEVPQVRERVIEAGKPFSFFIFHFHDDGTYRRSCMVLGNFLPSPSRDYELLFDEVPKGCRVRLYLLSLDEGGAILREPVSLHLANSPEGPPRIK